MSLYGPHPPLKVKCCANCKWFDKQRWCNKNQYYTKGDYGCDLHEEAGR